MSGSTQTSSSSDCTITIKPDSNGYVPPGTCGYHGKLYYPSFTLAAIFTAITSTILLGHLLQAARHPKSGLQRFAVVISTYLLLGYVARTVGTRDQQNIYLSAVSDTAVLVCPVLITILDCLVLEKLVRGSSPKPQIKSYTSQYILRCIGVCLVILSGLQLLTAAAIMTGNPPWLQVLGIRSYTVLIGIQGVIIICLFGLTLHFHTTVNNSRDSCSETLSSSVLVLSAIYFSLITISLRTVYRLVELPQVFYPDSILPHKEIFFYALESTPTLASIAVWALIPVGSTERWNMKSVDHAYQEIEGTVNEDDILCGVNNRKSESPR